MENEKWEIERWETICSNLEVLYFVSLVDINTESLILTIQDLTSNYEFVFEKHVGPYMVVDEGLRTMNSQLNNPPSGWTYIVKNSDFKPLLNQATMKVFFNANNLKHYVISTLDSCLEILASEEPFIRKYLIEENKEL